LNPHAGDDGLIGKEELEIIIHAIEKAKSEGLKIFGPMPADGYFGNQMHYKFDGTLAMYHDQGLIPFKVLGFEKGVNFTAGLPVVRTSPVHGTGFNIAGQNVADASSFREAIFMAIKILNNRKIYHEISKDPLKTKIIRQKEEGEN